MKKIFLLGLLILAFLNGCTSPGTETENIQITTPESTSTTQINATNTLLPESPTPTPSPTAAPPPKDFNAQNFEHFTGVVSYGSYLSQYFNKESSNVLTYTTDYSADGSTIAFGGCVYSCSTTLGGSIFLLLVDPALQQPAIEIPLESQRQIWDVDLNPDGSVLIFSNRGQVSRFDRSTGLSSLFYTPDDTNQAPFTAISPDGKTLVVVTESELTALNLADGSEIAHLSGTFWGQDSPFFNTQGNRLIVFSQKNERDVIVFNTTTWTEINRFSIARSGKAAISPDGKLVATLSDGDSSIKLYDIETSTVSDLTIEPYIYVSSLVFNPANDLLLVFGTPGSEVDIFEGVQIINLQTGKIVGSQTQYSNPGEIKFSADGTHFLRLSYYATDLVLWSLPTQVILSIEALVKDYFAAISSGDYQSATDMTLLDSYAQEEVVAAGLNPDDLPATFAALCKDDEVPCLPLKRIVRVMADFDRGWDYYAIVTLEQPDGSEIMFDDLTPFELLGIIQMEDESFKISTLHPGMRYPYQE